MRKDEGWLLRGVSIHVGGMMAVGATGDGLSLGVGRFHGRLGRRELLEQFELRAELISITCENGR